MIESLIALDGTIRQGEMMAEEVDWDSLTFSLTPTDTMYLTKTSSTDPWMPGDLRPYGPMEMSPSAGVLTYWQ